MKPTRIIPPNIQGSTPTIDRWEVRISLKPTAYRLFCFSGTSIRTKAPPPSPRLDFISYLQKMSRLNGQRINASEGWWWFLFYSMFFRRKQIRAVLHVYYIHTVIIHHANSVIESRRPKSHVLAAASSVTSRVVNKGSRRHSSTNQARAESAYTRLYTIGERTYADRKY